MSEGFSRSTGTTDSVDADLAAMAGEPLAAGPLRDEIEAHQRWFAEHRRPLRAAPARRPAWLAPVAAMAAVLAATVAVWALRPAEDGVRAMGGLPVAMAVHRGDEPVHVPPYYAGDEVHLATTIPADGLLAVYTVEADGDVSVLVDDEPVRAGQRWRLDGAARLDDHDGREWLIVTLRGDDAGDPVDEARGWLPDPHEHAGPRRFVVEITRDAGGR